jgi:hypothetical protein
VERAYDPITKQQLTVKEYGNIYGAKLDGSGNPRSRQVLQCPVCEEAVHLVAENSPVATPTWAHDPNPDISCPIKAGGAPRYELLTPKDGDPKAGERLRASFFAEWHTFWGYVRQVAPYPDIHTLIGFIQTANQTRFWEWRNLQLWQRNG